jgi:ATP-dependent Clp protease adaptor protein ClpS
MSKNREKKPSESWGEGATDVATDVDRKIEPPRLFQVLLHNDDYTTMDFVVMILMDVFHHPEEQAIEIMLRVHYQGIGVAGVYPYDVAETKVHKASVLAHQAEFPLRCSLEPV